MHSYIGLNVITLVELNPKTTKMNLIKSYYFDTTTTVRKRNIEAICGKLTIPKAQVPQIKIFLKILFFFKDGIKFKICRY